MEFRFCIHGVQCFSIGETIYFEHNFQEVSDEMLFFLILCEEYSYEYSCNLYSIH